MTAPGNGYRDVLSAKEQRMLEAARLRYMENKNYDQISDEINVKVNTVQQYFSDPEMQSFQRYYSDKKLYELQMQLEQDLVDAEQEALEWLGSAAEYADSSRAYTQAAKARIEVANKKLAMLQELGIIDKPGTQREDNRRDDSEEETKVEFVMDEAVEAKIEEKREQKVLPDQE